MSNLKQTLVDLEHTPGARATGHMFGNITTDGQVREFKANRLYVAYQQGALRFFGAQSEPQNPDAQTVIEVHLQPESIESGTYRVGSPEVKKIAYVAPDQDRDSHANSGEVSFNRSTSLAQIFGAVDAQFEIEGKLISIRCQYDVRGWGKGI